MDFVELNRKEFHILTTLVDGEASGRELHKSLHSEVVPISGPGFYKLMGRLRDMGLVTYRSEKVEVNGHRVREHRYAITGSGQRAVFETARYYAVQGGLLDV